jgi:adenylosuccinate synthase
MPVTILVGAQWGDEGKGRVVDLLAAEADVVARYAGGDNAGHTVSIGADTFKLHLIPSGILQAGTTCVLGHGMVVNPQRLLNEMDELREQGVEVTSDNLLLSDRAHVITPGHIALDTAREEARAANAIGTTQRGIGPAYTDKVLRRGIQSGHMHDPDYFGQLVHAHIQQVNDTLRTQFNTRPLDANAVETMYTDYARRLGPFVTNTTPMIHAVLAANQRLLCEGAQGTLLDIDMGHYPFVTSSSPAVGGALTGLGFGPTAVDRVVGVTKCFSTRVGSGPMPTEQENEIGNQLRGTGDNPWDEFGTTTGRPRRTGWLDGVVLRYAAAINGFTELVLTKLDVLTGFEELKIAVAYEIGGTRVEHLPSLQPEVEQATAIYETLPGWHEDISTVRAWDDLPPNARQYVEFVADIAGVNISLISVGPERSQVIQL